MIKGINCIIIHGCPDDEEKAMNPETRTYDKHWMPWLKSKLIANGINTEIPLMPEPWQPNYKAYKKVFEKYLVKENTILVGTSCGCAFLVRWLGETKQPIKKLILVAPWNIPEDENDEVRKQFYTYPIDETIKLRVQEIIMFTSNNESEDGKKSLQIFHEALGGRIVDLPNHGHYLFSQMGTEEFSELLAEIA